MSEASAPARAVAARRGDWAGLLEPGERLLWQGRSHPLRAPATEDLRGLLRAVPALLLVLFWLTRVPSFDPLFWLMGMVPITAGAWLLLWPALAPMLPGRRDYALTDRRALVARRSLLGPRRVQSWQVTPALRLELDDGDPGAVWFGPRDSAFGDEPAGFRAIDDARAVFALMQRVQRGEAG